MKQPVRGPGASLHRGRLPAAGCLAAVLAAVGFVAAAGPQDPPAAGEGGGGPPEGTVDLRLPAQEAFRDWPPPELQERPYWLGWSRLSFNRATLFDRPVLLLLTVPWSRPAGKMSAETLADPRVLRALNEDWICVAVDADHRPDIRERYQTGAWPVLTFLMSNGLPMLSSANDTGQPQPIVINQVDPERMVFLLEQGRLYYDRNKQELLQESREWGARQRGEEPVPGPVGTAASDALARWLIGSADYTDGGFGAAPKYVIAGLAEYAALRDARGESDLLGISHLTQQRLVAGPLYDPRDGGIRRIASQPQWQGIQDEKMLDKNAALLRELVFAMRSGAPVSLAGPLAGTAAWITRVLTLPGGGWALAERPALSPEGERRNEGIDRSILAGTNLLAAAALVRAGLWLDDAGLVRDARSTADRVLARAYLPGRGIDHLVRDSPRGGRMLATQSDAALGLVELYELTGDRRYLEIAREIVVFTLANFGGAADGPLSDRLPETQPIGLLALARRPLRDNVQLARAMLRMAWHLGDESYRQRARSILAGYAGDLAAYRIHGIEAALAAEEFAQEPVLIDLFGPGADGGAALRRAAHATPRIWTIVRTVDPAGEKSGATVRWRGGERAADTPEALLEALGELGAENGS